MNFPTLPTDSLYKLLAISGVIAIVSSAFLASSTMISMQDAKEKELRDFLDRREEYLWRVIDGVRKDHEEKEERTRELNSMKPQMDEVFKVEHEGFKSRIADITSAALTIMNMLGILERVGYVAALFGFAGWWFKVQKYQDVLLRIEAQKALKETPLEFTPFELWRQRQWTWIKAWFIKPADSKMNSG